MAVAHSGQRLHTEEEAIKKPMPTGSASDTAWLETIKRGEKKIERDIQRADKHRKLWPPQTKQRAIKVVPSPCVGTDSHELNVAGTDGMTRSRFNAPSAEFSQSNGSWFHPIIVIGNI